MPSQAPDRDWEVAIHEAGHAVMHVKEGLPFDRVTIDASTDRGGGGAVVHPPIGSNVFDAMEDSAEQDALARRHMRACWGGALANEIAGQKLDVFQWEQDRRDLGDFATQCLGAEEEAFSTTRASTLECLSANWRAVVRVAEALRCDRTLTVDEVSRILERIDLDSKMENMLNRPVEEQLAYLRREMAEIRAELALLREAMARAIREQITAQAEPKGPSEN